MPLVHDLRSVQRDRPLYEDLYRRTAEVAEPVIGEALRRVTADQAGRLLTNQLGGLQQFVLELPRDGEPRTDPELGSALNAFIEADLRHDGAVVALTHSLAEEFSLGFWDWMLKRMREHASATKTVARSDLGVVLEGEAAEQWADLDELLVPFALQRADAAAVFEKVLRQLSDAAHGDVVQLPLGLSIDKEVLDRVLTGQTDPEQRMLNFLRDWLDRVMRT